MKLVTSTAIVLLGLVAAQDPRRAKKNKNAKAARDFFNAFSIDDDMDAADQAKMSGMAQTAHDWIMHKLKNASKDERKNFSNYVAMMQEDKEADVDGGVRNLNCASASCNIPLNLRGVWGYGCWCYFGNDLLKGRGTPVNPHDSACERMQQCLKCARMDGIDGGYNCDPKTALYSAAFFPVSATNTLGSGCSTQNPGNLCGSHICTCEMQFINDILDLVWQGYQYDPSFTHPNNPAGGTFDADANCAINTPIDADVECCGAYPFRYPFNSLDKDCCDSTATTYNPFESNCCTGGIQPISDGPC